MFTLKLNDSKLLKNLVSLPFYFVAFMFWSLSVMIMSWHGSRWCCRGIFERSFRL